MLESSINDVSEKTDEISQVSSYFASGLLKDQYKTINRLKSQL